MTLHEVKFAELQGPFHFAGKNFGEKLDPGSIGGLGLDYDDETERLLVHFNKQTTNMPMPNVKHYVLGKPEKKAQQHTHPMVAGIGNAQIHTPGLQPDAPSPGTHFTAQVQTPMAHVHAGPGAGKTGKDK